MGMFSHRHTMRFGSIYVYLPTKLGHSWGFYVEIHIPAPWMVWDFFSKAMTVPRKSMINLW